MTETTKNPPGTTSLDVKITSAELRQFGLFGALSESVLEHLAEHLTIFEAEPGTYIFREGDDANSMFLVLQGDMEVLKRSKFGPDARVAVLGPGDWFGEMGVIDVQPRSAAVMTVSPARFLKITAADLDRLYRHDVKAYSLIVLNIAREMSRRLRVADGILADLIANVVDGYTRGPANGST